MGAKLAYLVNSQGLIVAWESGDAGMADNAFQPLISDFEDEMVVFTDMAFHAADGVPPEPEGGYPLGEAWDVEWTDGCGNGALDADGRVQPQEVQPAMLGWGQRETCLYNGTVQHLGHLGWIGRG